MAVSLSVSGKDRPAKFQDEEVLVMEDSRRTWTAPLRDRKWYQIQARKYWVEAGLYP
jgi:hypothetical protein